MTEPDYEPAPRLRKHDEICGASTDGARRVCGQRAGWGTDHPGVGRCKHHGGSTTAQRKHVAKIQARANLEAAIKTFGLPLDVSPQQALIHEVQWTAGHVQWLREQVQELSPEAMGWGVQRIEHRRSGEFPGTDVYEAAYVNILIELYQRERKHLVDVCRVAIAAGIEERRVKLAESQGAVLAAGLNRMFDQLGLSLAQKAKLPELMPAMFASIRDQWSAN